MQNFEILKDCNGELLLVRSGGKITLKTELDQTIEQLQQKCSDEVFTLFRTNLLNYRDHQGARGDPFVTSCMAHVIFQDLCKDGQWADMPEFLYDLRVMATMETFSQTEMFIREYSLKEGVDLQTVLRDLAQ
jgi:hypothetical protein